MRISDWSSDVCSSDLVLVKQNTLFVERSRHAHSHSHHAFIHGARAGPVRDRSQAAVRHHEGMAVEAIADRPMRHGGHHLIDVTDYFAPPMIAIGGKPCLAPRIAPFRDTLLEPCQGLSGRDRKRAV